MGQCCNTRNLYCDDENENIYREIIASFPKYSYSEYKPLLADLFVSEGDTSELSEEKYQIFRKKVVANKHKYTLFHKEMVPSWQLAWQLAYKENFHANVLIWVFGFLKENEQFRYEILLEILGSTESYFDTANFIEFLEYYLTLQLITINSSIIRALAFQVRNNLEIDGRKIDNDAIVGMEQTLLKLSNKVVFKRFIQSLESEVSRVYMKFCEYDRVTNKLEGAFTKKMFIELNREFGFLWNPLTLRLQYYNYVFDNHSVISDSR